MTNKAEMSMEMIVFAVIALIVLIVSAIIFVNFSTDKGTQIEGQTNKLTCEGNNGKCIATSDCTSETLNFFCGLDKVCCKS